MPSDQSEKNDRKDTLDQEVYEYTCAMAKGRQLPRGEAKNPRILVITGYQGYLRLWGD